MANFLPFTKLFDSASRGNRKQDKKRRKAKPNPKQLILETLEERLVLTSPQLMSIVPSGQGLLKDNDVLDVAPNELLFQFDSGQAINPQTAMSSIRIIRSGDGVFGNGNDITVTPGFIGLGDRSDQIVVRFADTLPDDFYRIEITGQLRNIQGEQFNNGQTFRRDFQLDLAPRVVAVVPQPIDRNPTTGEIIGQRKNQVDVYFSSGDALSKASAEDVRFYQLIDTKGTVDPSDDVMTVPLSAVYTPGQNRVTLTFANDLPEGTYRLRIGDSLDADNSIINVGTLFNVGSTTTTGEFSNRTDFEFAYQNQDFADGTTTAFVGAVTTTNPARDVEVTVNLLTTDPNGLADLSLFLVAPNGTRVQLFAAGDLTGQLLTDAQFDSDVTTLIGAGAQPYTGVFRALGDLSVFDAIDNASGNWVLEVVDGGNVTDGGALLSWGLSFASPQAIANNAITTSTINVTNPGQIQDIKVKVEIDHTDLSDVAIALIAPDGTRVQLVNLLTLSGNEMTQTVFDAGATTPIAVETSPYTGTFIPVGDLSMFDGINGLGTWTLEIRDGGNSFGGGTLRSWSLNLTQAMQADALPEYTANGHIGDNGGVNDIDQYKINLKSFGDLTVRVTPTAIGDTAPTLNVSVQLLRNEIQRINLDTPTGGTFTLTFNGATTGPLSFDATAEQIQSALTSLATVGSNNVLVTLVAPGIFDVTFRNNLGFRDVTTLTGNFAGLVNAASAAISVVAEGQVPVTVNDGLSGDKTFSVQGIQAGDYVIAVRGDGNSTGSYRLEVDFSEPFVVNDINSSLAEAAVNADLGILGAGGIFVSAEITHANPFPIKLPGSADEPGQREIAKDGEGLIPGGAGDTLAGITRIFYSFPQYYGVDNSGNQLQNVITANQKQRAREIFEILSQLIGVEFVESQNDEGIRIVTGDIHALDPTAPKDAVGGISNGTFGNGGLVIMNATFDYGQSEFGGSWQQIAFHEIGHSLGLGHALHLPGSIMGGSEAGQIDAGIESIFPGDYDITALRALFAPESRDIDLYKFQVTDTGMFTAETFAERLGVNDPRNGSEDFGLLNTVLSLFDSAGNLIARNDDYFSNDSFLKVMLTPGTYYIGVTSTGNIYYDPRISDSGFGGTTEGPYDLRLNFEVIPPAAIVDTDGTIATRLDGDADGVPGGAYNFWFEAGNTIFVDKADGSPGGNGDLNNAYQNIGDAILAASNQILTVAGSKINDGDTITIGDGIRTATFEFVSNGVVKAVAGANADGRTFRVNGVLYELDTDGIINSGQAIAVNLDDTAEEVAEAIVAAIGGNRVGDRVEFGPGVTVSGGGGLEVSGANGFTAGNIAVNFSIDDTAEEIAAKLFAALNASNLSSLNGGLILFNQAGARVTLDGAFASLDLSGTKALIQKSSIIRILGNTIGQAYLIGVDENGNILEDGAALLVPQGVTLMIDAGAVFKLRKANIEVGSSQLGIDRSGGAIQVLGTPTNNVYFTSYRNDTLRDANGNIVLISDDDGISNGPNRGDWGGIVFRADSDLEEDGIFLNSVNNADLQYGGGVVTVDSTDSVFTPIHAIGARPAITYNTIRFSADAAISADPNSFEETHIQVGAPNKVGESLDPPSTGRRTRADYDRVGLDISSNRLLNNSINGLFIRINTEFGSPVDRLNVLARLDDTDITHVLTQTLFVSGSPGGPLRLADGRILPRLDAGLVIDAGVVIKLGAARIEVEFGANLIAEGRNGRDVVFTSIYDDSFGAGGNFDTTDDFGAIRAQAGDWGGIYLNPTSFASLDHVYLAYGGGAVTIEGGTENFNAIEARQATLRLANSRIENNAGGASINRSTTARNGRGANDDAAIFIRGTEATIVNNIIRDNVGPAISIDVNSLSFDRVEDFGRSTGTTQRFNAFADNRGALVRLNRLFNNDINGMRVRGGILTTQGVWDDTDIVHVVLDEIEIPNVTTYGGLRIESSQSQSLVVKLSGPNAGFTAGGTPLDIDDRIGGAIQILGRPGRPVIFTSLADDSEGAGFDPNGKPQKDTNNDGNYVAPPKTPPVPVGGFFDEVGDAGQLPGSAQAATGIGQLFGIRGTLTTGNDVDVYRILITDPAQFSATIGGLTTVPDTQLFLFDMNGNPVYANDDGGGGLDATLPAGSAFGPLTPGVYLLAISAFNNDPRDAQGRSLFDTDTNLNAVVGPNPGVNSLATWGGGGLTGGTYQINLVGAQFLSGGTSAPQTSDPGIVVGEQGDAGYLPQTAQTINAPAVAGIRGNLDRIGDVDVYRIYIANPSTFSASTVGQTFSGTGAVDTQLFLFDSSGKGVIASGNVNGRIESAINAADAAPLLTPGYYYLAIASVGTNPMDLNYNQIFNMAGQPASVTANPNANDVRGWDLFGRSTGTYTIQLTGVGAASSGETNTDWWKSVLTSDSTLAESKIVSVDNPDNHIVQSGTGFDGVARLIITKPNGTFISTGALLTSGRHILSAAHSFTDSFGFLDPSTTVQVTFESPQGVVTMPAVPASRIFVHPQYDGNTFSSYDIAVLELSIDAPDFIDRYDIMRSGNPLNQTHTKVGYGASGDGNTGAVLPSGTRRSGQNTYDAYGEILNGSILAAGTLVPGSVLLFDFDNGQAANDALGRYFGINNLGLGVQEINSAGGDSGGPTFINGLIAGVTSFGFTLVGAGTADINGILDSSFGEVSGDVSTAFHSTWIDSITGGASNAQAPVAGDWRSIRIDVNSGDRNVGLVLEAENSFLNANDVNRLPTTAQFIGDLARGESNADDNLRVGFEIHGSIAYDSPGDIDVYSFTAEAGTEVWLDIDRTDYDLDTVIELISANGAVLARSDNSLQNSDGTFVYGDDTISGRGLGRGLMKSLELGEDFYGTNPLDAGMRVILPGTPGTRQTYYVRVRSRGDDIDNVTSGKSRGAYQLQIRTRQVDEFPGSVVAFADIRYAQNGVEVFGQPSHSPLTGDTAEANVPNDLISQAQQLGNLLTSDRNSLSVSGNLSSATDVDWYQFTVDYDLVQAIGGVNSGLRTISTIFDIDFADGLSRPDLTLSVFDSAGNLILVARDGNILDDREAGASGGISNPSAGSFGANDPYIGPVQLPEGQSRTYYVAVSSNRTLPAELNGTFQGNATNPYVRLEPVNSIDRIVEDHIGFAGYVEGNGTSSSSAAQNPLFGSPGQTNDMTLLQTHAKEFTLADVVMFASSGNNLLIINPFTGQQETIVNGNLGLGVRDFHELEMRPDGVLVALTDGDADGNAGNLIRIDTGTGAVTTLGDDGVAALRGYDALAYRGDVDPGNASYTNWFLYAVSDGNVLRRLNPLTGAQLNPGGGTASPGPVGTITVGGVAITDAVTGMAFIGNNLYVVTNSGRLLLVNTNNATAVEIASGILSTPGAGGGTFTSLHRGPRNLMGGAFYNTLFATTSTGRLVCLDTQGNLLPVFAGGALSVTVGNLQGIAFSTLDYNLWHTTLTRRDDLGHGINRAFDFSREEVYVGGVTGDNGGRTINQDEGGVSWYFGLQRHGTDEPDNDRETLINQPDSRNYRFRTNNGLSDIYNTYDLPGGAKGSLITNSFSLADYEATDKPTLYFNYYLETQDANSATNGMRDSARVFVSPDGGITWVEVATNNSTRNLDTSELPAHPTASDQPSIDPRQTIQELFDNTGTWRQARIDLSQFVGLDNLLLRFDFSTAGTMNEGIPGDSYGNLASNQRGQANNFEGFYVDDVMIGLAGRGEMVTRPDNDPTPATTDFFTTPADPRPGAPSQNLTGSYQLEIRRGVEYGQNINGIDPTIFLFRSFNARDLLGQHAMIRVDSDVVDKSGSSGVQVISDGEVFFINGQPFEIEMGQTLDISQFGQLVDGDLITVDGFTYEFDTGLALKLDGSVLSGPASSADGTLISITIAGVTRRFELDTDGTVTSGIGVSFESANSIDDAARILAGAIAGAFPGTMELVTYAGDTVYVRNNRAVDYTGSVPGITEIQAHTDVALQVNGLPPDGRTFTLDDGTNGFGRTPVTFEFTTDGTVAAGRQAISLIGVTNLADLAARIADAVNATVTFAQASSSGNIVFINRTGATYNTTSSVRQVQNLAEAGRWLEVTQTPKDGETLVITTPTQTYRFQFVDTASPAPNQLQAGHIAVPFATGDDLSDIAASLASIINARVDVSAVSDGTVVRVINDRDVTLPDLQLQVAGIRDDFIGQEFTVSNGVNSVTFEFTDGVNPPLDPSNVEIVLDNPAMTPEDVALAIATAINTETAFATASTLNATIVIQATDLQNPTINYSFTGDASNLSDVSPTTNALTFEVLQIPQVGETFTLDDGAGGAAPVTFEFTLGGGASAGNIEISLVGVNSTTLAAQAIADAINGNIAFGTAVAVGNRVLILPDGANDPAVEFDYAEFNQPTGMRVIVPDVGFEFTAIPPDGASFTLDDGAGGLSAVRFEFDDDGTVSPGNIAINIQGIVDLNVLVQTIVSTINANISFGTAYSIGTQVFVHEDDPQFSTSSGGLVVREVESQDNAGLFLQVPSNPSDGDVFSISVVGQTFNFEFDVNNSVAAGRIAVPFAFGDTAEQIAAALATAINTSTGGRLIAIANGDVVQILEGRVVQLQSNNARGLLTVDVSLQVTDTPMVGETFTVDDGVGGQPAVTFEFTNGGAAAPGNVAISLVGVTNFDEIAARIATVVNGNISFGTAYSIGDKLLVRRNEPTDPMVTVVGSVTGLVTNLDADVTFDLTNIPFDAETFVLDDGAGGSSPVTFEFNAGGGVTPGNVQINVANLTLDDLEALAQTIAQLIDSSISFGNAFAIGTTIFIRRNDPVLVSSVAGVTQTGYDGVGTNGPTDPLPGLPHIPVRFQYEEGQLGFLAEAGNGTQLARALANAVNANPFSDVVASAGQQYVSFLNAASVDVRGVSSVQASLVPDAILLSGANGVQTGSTPVYVGAGFTAQDVAAAIAAAVNGSSLGQGNGGIIVARSGGSTVAFANAQDIVSGGALITERNDISAFKSKGDENSVRDQGHVQIISSKFTNNAGYGVVVDGAPRVDGIPGNGIRNTPVLNQDRVVPSVLIVNNLFAYNETGGLLLGGDPNAAGDPPAASPFALVVNNTFYGGATAQGVGVQIEDNAKPTLINNIFSNLETGIALNPANGATVVVIANTYKGNTTNTNFTNLDSFAQFLQASDPLFADPANGNFYLASGSKAIDSALNSLEDRPQLAAVKASLGIDPSPILAPTFDINGIKRQDDPNAAPPAGMGSNIFKDRGAFERADFDGPRATLINPEDNDSALMDLDPALTKVTVAGQNLSVFEIQLNDALSGIDDSTVLPSVIRLFRDGGLLTQGVHYNFSYDSTNDIIRLTAGGSFFATGTYTILVDNSAVSGVKDLAGNRLFRNQTADEVRFTITVTAQAPPPLVQNLQAFNFGLNKTAGTTLIAGTLAGSVGLQLPSARLTLTFESVQSNGPNPGTVQTLGTINVITDATGNASFQLSINGSIDGEFLRITVRDDFGNQLSQNTTNAVGPNATGPRAFVSALVNDMLQRDRGLVAGPALEFENLEGQPLQTIVLNFARSTEFDAITVSNLYNQLLGRAPTGAQLNAGVNLLQSGGSANNIRRQLLVSDEFYIGRGGNTPNGYINAVYNALLGRGPNATELFNAGRYLQEGGRNAMVNLVLGTPEFNDVLVARLFPTYFGRQARPAEIAQASTLLDNGVSEDEVLARLLGGNIAATGREYYFDKVVRTAYRDYLQRNPTANELSNSVAALLGGLSETDFRARLLGDTLEFYNNSELDGNQANNDEEFVRDLYRDVLGNPAPLPGDVTALLDLRASFGAAENDPNATPTAHRNWRIAVATQLLGQQRTVGLGPLAAAGNNAPLLLPLSNQVVSYSQGTILLDVYANDFDGDHLEYSATARNEYAEIKRTYGFNTPVFAVNRFGQGDKWLRGGAGDYFILPNGYLYRHLGGGLNGRLIRYVGLDVYENPSLVINAQTAPPATVGFYNNQLVITPTAGFTGTFLLDVQAFDGQARSVQTIAISVVNNAPVVQKIADQQIRHNQDILLVPVEVEDVDGDPLNISVSISNTLADIQRKYGFNTPVFAVNRFGQGEKWLTGGPGDYFILPNGYLYRHLGGGLNGRLLEYVGTDVYQNPALLTSASQFNPGTVSYANGNLVVDPADGFVGTFTVVLSVTDGADTTKQSFKVTVTNDAPIITVLSDQTVSHTEDEIRLSFSTDDADGDDVTVTASISSTLADIQRKYGFNTPVFAVNRFGQGEKWLTGGPGDYFILPNGYLYRHLGGGLNGRLLEYVGIDVYQNPVLLTSANQMQPGTVQVDNGELIINPADGFTGSFTVNVTASDGIASTKQSFKVTVINNAPVLTPIEDQTITGSKTLDLEATDGDGDDITFSAQIVSEAFELGRKFGLQEIIGVNTYGMQEKWFRGAFANFFLLPNGNLFRHLGGSVTNNSFVASLGADVYADPRALIDANYLSSVATLTVDGNQLTIQPVGDFSGTFTVRVTASDGNKADQKTFTVTVPNASAGGNSIAHDPHSTGSGNGNGDDLVDSMMLDIDEDFLAMLGLEGDDDLA